MFSKKTLRMGRKKEHKKLKVNLSIEDNKDKLITIFFVLFVYVMKDFKRG
jgi:hypothetical protein